MLREHGPSGKRKLKRRDAVTDVNTAADERPLAAAGAGPPRGAGCPRGSAGTRLALRREDGSGGAQGPGAPLGPGAAPTGAARARRSRSPRTCPTLGRSR